MLQLCPNLPHARRFYEILPPPPKTPAEFYVPGQLSAAAREALDIGASSLTSGRGVWRGAALTSLPGWYIHWCVSRAQGLRHTTQLHRGVFS